MKGFRMIVAVAAMAAFGLALGCQNQGRQQQQGAAGAPGTQQPQPGEEQRTGFPATGGSGGSSMMEQQGSGGSMMQE